ncbi:MAG TPA: hypothetical protein VFW00_00485 [Rhodocyclaceae bacterium]|nr:hypothetical protein [Rhodocyclaceae bacterium]
MSRWRRNALGLGVGAGEMAVLSIADGTTAKLLSHVPLADYLPGTVDAVTPAATANWEPSVSVALAQTQLGRADLHVTVADDLARYWMVAPPQGVNSLAELRSLAENRFESLFSDTAQHWHIEADWRIANGIFACALPSSFVASLRATSARQGCTLKSVQPLAVRLLNRHAKDIKPNAWLCVFSARGVVSVLVTGGHATIVRQFRFTTPPLADEMLVRLETEVLRAGTEMPPTVYFAGDAPVIGTVSPREGVELIALGRQRVVPKVVSGTSSDGGIAANMEVCRLALAGVFA